MSAEDTRPSPAAPSSPSPTSAQAPSHLTVAIAGNPNTGKTTLLNLLAGANFSVGNWPGVTVEKKEGTAVYQNTTFHFVDLPGIYTLEPLSEDERIAANYLTTEKPDVILNVVETPNLARNLGLTLELAQFNTPMVLALNMADEARRAGLSVNLPALENKLGAKALPTIGRTGAGVKELLPAILQAHAQGHPPNAIGQNTREDRQRAADALYAAVAIKREARGGHITQKLDAVLLHPLFGLLAYLVIMYLFFKISFDFSAPYMDWLDGFVNGFLAPLARQTLLAVNAPPLLAQFVAEAVLGGFAFVLTFLPLIAVMFFLLTLLGMSGYMARLPFVLDRFMSKIGLDGKAIIPLLLGLGCNVPAIMATRALESKRDKMIVCLMIPFMSCPARLVVFSFFAVLFFPNPALVIMGLYLMGVVVAIGTSLFIKQRMFKNSPSLMVMELPPYRMPRLRTVGAIVWSHTREFLDRAGRVIFTVSVAVWLLIHVPFGAKPADSLVASAGKAITPIFAPIGLTDWRATTSLIPAFLAREVALSFMATIYAAEQEDPPPAEPMNVGAALRDQGVNLAEAVKNSVVSLFNPGFSTLEVTDNEDNALKDAVKNTFTPLSSLSFMILLLLYNSCLAVYSVMSKELGRKFANWFMVYSFIIGWVVAFVVYQGGRLLGGS